MANPAQLLLTQLNAWHGPPANAESLRGVADDPEWLNHRLAVRHLDALDQLLDEMAAGGRNVKTYRKFFPAWCRSVFAFPRGWQGQNSAAIDRTARDHLETLADRLDDLVPSLQPGGLGTLRTYAKQVTDTLSADTSIPVPLRNHVNEIVSHLLWCIDKYDLVGDFHLQEAVERLAATVVRVAAASDKNNRQRWQTVMDGFVWPFTVNVLAAIPSAALAQLALPQ